MALLDRLLFWTAERRGFRVTLSVEKEPESCAVDADPNRDADVITARQHNASYSRKIEHLDALADVFGLTVPSREEQRYVDIR